MRLINNSEVRLLTRVYGMYNRSYVLASHESLPVQMDLSTAETPTGKKLPFPCHMNICMYPVYTCM